MQIEIPSTKTVEVPNGCYKQGLSIKHVTDSGVIDIVIYSDGSSRISHEHTLTESQTKDYFEGTWVTIAPAEFMTAYEAALYPIEAQIEALHNGNFTADTANIVGTIDINGNFSITSENVI